MAALISCVLVTVGLGGCRNDSGPTIPSTIQLPAGRAPDSSLLPHLTTFPDRYDTTITNLVAESRHTGVEGLTALLDLLHGTGVRVVDTLTGEVVQEPAAPVQAEMSAEQVYAVNLGLNRGDTLSLANQAAALDSVLGAG